MNTQTIDMTSNSPEGRVKFGYLVGDDNHDEFKLFKEEFGSSGCSDIFHLRTLDPSGYNNIHVPKNYFRQNLRHKLDWYDCLVNLVTDPDQNPKVLANLVKLAQSYRGPIINHPAKVVKTTRERVAQALSGIPGTIVPQTIRLTTNKPRIVLHNIEKAQMTFPAILREVGTHTGQVLGLCTTADEVAAKIKSNKDHYLTSFYDSRDSDGLYRKYRVFIIGQMVIFRHLLISDNWNVHASARSDFMSRRLELCADEIFIFENGMPPKVIETISRIRDIIELDFFGIDFSLDSNDDLILFEANATMNFFPVLNKPPFAHVEKCLAPAQEAWNLLLYSFQEK